MIERAVCYRIGCGSPMRSSDRQVGTLAQYRVKKRVVRRRDRTSKLGFLVTASVRLFYKRRGVIQQLLRLDHLGLRRELIRSYEMIVRKPRIPARKQVVARSSEKLQQRLPAFSRGYAVSALSF